jgi:Carbohydrate phosphorylase
LPHDRPVVGYGGKTVNTLRLWGAAAAQSFDFQRFSEGDFVASMAESLGAESLTPRSLPRRHDAARSRAPPDARIFPRCLFARRHRATVSTIEFGLAQSRGQSSHSA